MGHPTVTKSTALFFPETTYLKKRTNKHVGEVEENINIREIVPSGGLWRWRFGLRRS